MGMKLYSVLRWGNEYSDEGPDGEDTEFLVKANNHEEAARLVDERLGETESPRVQNFCHSVAEVAICTTSDQTSKILIGPIISNMSVFSDDGVPHNKIWRRDEVSEPWITLEEYF